MSSTDGTPEGGPAAATPIDDGVSADESTAPPDDAGGVDDATGRRSVPWRTIGSWTLGAVVVVILLLIVATVVPVSSSGLDARPDATTSYDEATERFAQLTADEAADGVTTACRSRLLVHDAPTDRVVVLFHGLTNCPEQFEEFGNELHESGANVIILRAPRHGLGDENGKIQGVSAVGGLSAQELRDFADDSIDIATGLGDRVEVLGLSMGGVLALWSGEFRDDVDRVVAVAPAISIPNVPHFVTTGFVNLANRLPNVSLPSSGAKLDHTYAGESTGALAGMFLLARAVENEIPSGTAAAESVVVVLNPDDEQVDNAEVTQLVDRWSDDDGSVEIVVLDTDGLPHDLIDPAQPASDVESVYPTLLELLAEGS